jgi:HAD superfamily hydrolase (TIGR01509 family)
VIRAVFFDMDGVLIDSEPVWQEAIDAVFGGLGIVLDAELKARTAGMGNEESVRLVLDRHPAVRADVRQVCARIDGAVLARIGEGIGAIPGADALVRELAAAGLPLALVSTSGPALMRAVVQAHRLDGLFRVVLSSEEVGPGKPDPAVYREALRRLGADAAAGVAIEDTVNGARSAHGAGLRVIGFTRDPAVSGRMQPYVWRVAAGFGEVREYVLGRRGRWGS